jgi:hypothetical protein
LATPTRPSPAAAIATLSELGFLELTGFSRSMLKSTLTVPLPTTVHCSGVLASSEIAVANLFRVNAAIGGEVDVLKKNAPQRGGDFVSGLIDIHGDPGAGSAP